MILTLIQQAWFQSNLQLLTAVARSSDGDRATANLTTVGVAADRGIAVYLLWANLKMPIKLESS